MWFHAVLLREAAENPSLTNPPLDPFGKIPEFKFWPVRASVPRFEPRQSRYGRGVSNQAYQRLQ